MKTQIQEVILENFMSHEYSRIPLSSGLNLICGPNGSGKSSILLGIAVALGQTYTERSKRLGDLIMRGKNMARVSVVFDNRPFNGKRPIPEMNSDVVVLSRYLSKEGDYWYQINNRTVSKGEVMRLLRRLSIDPDNMLIIMHQNMIDTFGSINSSEKLRMVEEAVGIYSYRERIIEAQQKLSHTLSEEESIKLMLQRANETLKYWEGEYERFKHKRELERRRKELEREYAWSKVLRQEESTAGLEQKQEEITAELGEVRKEGNDWSKRKRELEIKLEKLDGLLDGQYRTLIERERSEAERRGRLQLLREVERLAKVELFPGLPDSSRMEEELNQLRQSIEREETRLAEIKGDIVRSRRELNDASVKVAVLDFRKSLLEHELADIRKDLRRARKELEELQREALKTGKRVESKRKPQEVLDELRMVNAQLGALADVSPDVERMYMGYHSTLRELERKAREAEANRRKALEELELRKQRWKEELHRLLKEVNWEYRQLLHWIGGEGEVRVVDAEDIEKAGLELTVGFRGVKPQVVDPYTQSGGERTTALMCFLLALQRKIRSPVRAVDEFEAHLDPKNREFFFKKVAEVASQDSSQYLVITPGRLFGVRKSSNVIVVQSVSGVSRVGVVS